MKVKATAPTVNKVISGFLVTKNAMEVTSLEVKILEAVIHYHLDSFTDSKPVNII